MKEGFETCTFCHRQALMAEAFRAEVEALRAKVARLEAKLRVHSHTTGTLLTTSVPSSPGKDAA